MTDKNPWQQDDEDHINKYRKYDYYDTNDYGGRKYKRSSSHFLRFIVFMIGMILLVIGLTIAIPETAFRDHNLIRASLIVLLFGGIALYWSRGTVGRMLKNLGLWLFFILGASFFYLYQSDFSDRFMAAIDPTHQIDSEDDVIIVRRADDGHFWVKVWINDIPVRMMVDTGATNVVLSPRDAKAAGIDLDDLNFNRSAQTANGTVAYARFRADKINIGNSVFYDQVVTVNSADMANSLLGNRILNQFSSLEIRKNILYLRP